MEEFDKEAFSCMGWDIADDVFERLCSLGHLPERDIAAGRVCSGLGNALGEKLPPILHTRLVAGLIIGFLRTLDRHAQEERFEMEVHVQSLEKYEDWLLMIIDQIKELQQGQEIQVVLDNFPVLGNSKLDDGTR